MGNQHYLLSFLLLSSSISSILHLFPTHDDIILPIFPIQLILLPISYDDVYPQASTAAVRGVQPQPAAARGVQPQPAAARGVQSQPSKQQLVVYSSSRQSRRTCRGPRGRRRKRRKIAQSSEY